MAGIHLAQGEKSIPRIVQAIRGLMQGRDDASGVLNLTANATSTVVEAPNCSSGSNVFLTPGSANASAEWKNGTIYVSNVGNGSFTIAHANATTTNRTVYWTARG